MLNLNFERLESEPGCFVKKGSTPKDSIIVVVHVDDLLSVGKREKLDRYFAQLAETLKIKHIEYIENGKPVLFLGDYITKYKDKITLKSKDTYVDNLLTMLSMEGCKPTDTPMVRKESAANGDEKLLEEPEAETYRSVVGILMYFKRHRFDLTSGGIIYFEGAVLTFWSRTQTSIALSSCEAELYAINMATIEALNVKSTIEELINNCKTNITVYTDSSSAKSITSRRGVTRKTKHIELRQLFVQELVANGTLQMTKVGTLSHPADIFTQFVSSETIQRQLHAVGLRCMKLIHAIQAIRCVPSDFVEVSETQAHETRAMAMLNFDVTKFLEAERPKYDVKMFGDPYQVWYDDREKVITFCCITPGMTDYTTVFEIDEEVVTTAKIMAKCEMNTKLHWSIFNDDDDIFPTQIAYRAMTNFSYANGRAKNGCPICARLVPDDYKTYRDVREMPKDDLTNMIRLVSEPYWLWRSEVIDDNANLDDIRSTKKTDDSNKDKDEKEPKVPFELTAIPDRREGVLNDTAESVISSIYT